MLVSGCQFNETSADANPNPSDPSSAHGALSFALANVLKANKYRISSKDLVEAVRKQMASQKLSQHPCLYGPEDVTSGAFVLHNA